MADFEIGDIVKGKKFGPLEHEFSGVVEKVYTNSIMVSIQDFDPMLQRVFLFHILSAVP